MAEYIEREAALGVLCEYCPCDPGCNKDKCYEHSRIREMPAADVVEVRHGEWVGEMNMRLNLPQLSAYDDWHCSECDWVYPERHISRLSNYCPNCGAKMDGKGEGE